MGAFWAVNSHFSSDPEAPALVSLPTGAGKTTLMMLLSFGFEADRVLIVTASEVLRTQTKEKFDELDGLTDAGVVPNGM
jgi:superfamily II DNA or RNA helicase